MSVCVKSAQFIKALALQASELSGQDEASVVATFARLHAASVMAYSLSYAGRPLSKGEHRAAVREVEQAEADAVRLSADEVLREIHLLRYNGVANEGQDAMPAALRPALRRIVAGVASELLIPGSKPVKLDTYAYLRRLPDDAETLAMRVQLLTSEDPAQPAQFRDEKASHLARLYHGAVYEDGHVPRAFVDAWRVNDVLDPVGTEEYEQDLSARFEALQRRAQASA